MAKRIINVDGQDYVHVDDAGPKPTVMSDRVIVRCRNAGVHVGTLKSRGDNVVRLTDANRIWRWRGANTLSEVAMSGVVRTEYTRIATMVPVIDLTESDVCEVIPVARDVDLSEVWNV